MVSANEFIYKSSAELFMFCKLQSGCTALMLASLNCKEEMVMVLLDRGADINYQNKVNNCYCTIIGNIIIVSIS